MDRMNKNEFLVSVAIFTIAGLALWYGISNKLERTFFWLPVIICILGIVIPSVMQGYREAKGGNEQNRHKINPGQH